jgi:hypothetical protein
MIDFEKMMELIDSKTKCDDISNKEKDYYAVCAKILEYIDGFMQRKFANFDIDFVDDELNIRIKRINK